MTIADAAPTKSTIAQNRLSDCECHERPLPALNNPAFTVVFHRQRRVPPIEDDFTVATRTSGLPCGKHQPHTGRPHSAALWPKVMLGIRDDGHRRGGAHLFDHLVGACEE